MKTRRFPLLLLAVALALVLAGPALACTSIPVSKSASADGSVMTAHTCDGWYDARTWVVPAADHKDGDKVAIYSGMLHDDRTPAKKIGEIPEVAHTSKWFYVGYPYMNEHGVIHGETTISGRRELRSSNGLMFIETLQALGLARAKTARECVQIMGDLATQYGYIDAGECLTVGDQNEVWFFEIFGAGPLNTGAVWAAVRIPEGHIGVSANRSRIDKVDVKDTANYMASANVYSLAQEMGWWDPSSGKEFCFYDAYGPSEAQGSRRREWRVLSWAAPSLKLDATSSRFPFTVKAEKPITVQDMMAIYRDTYTGTVYDKANNPAWFMRDSKGNFVKSPFATPYAGTDALSWLDIPNERNISIPGCSYFTILQSRGWMDPGLGTLTWFGLNNTGTSVYVPVYAGINYLPKNYAVNDRSKFSMTNHLESAWWAFDFVDNLVNQRYQDMIKDVQAVRDPFEAEQFALQPTIEKVAAELYAKDPKAAAEFLTNYTNGRCAKAVDMYWKLAETLIAKYDDKTF